MTKIKVLATGQSPDFYEVSGEVLKAYHAGQEEVYDLTGFPEGAVFQGADPVNGVTAIRDVARIDGELHVTLCQQVGPGHWSESGWFAGATYDPDAIHVKRDTSKTHSGTAWAKTRKGQVKG